MNFKIVLNEIFKILQPKLYIIGLSMQGSAERDKNIYFKLGSPYEKYLHMTNETQKKIHSKKQAVQKTLTLGIQALFQ